MLTFGPRQGTSRCIAAATAAIALLALAACGDEILEDKSARTKQPATSTPTADTRSPEELGQALIAAVETVLDSDPSLCGTELAAALPSVEAAAGSAFDQAGAEGLIRELCAERDSMAAGDLPSTSEYRTFGETFTWEDGLAVTVSAPFPFTPSEGLEVDGATAHLRFTITIANGTNAAFDPALASDQLQSGSVEAETIFDGQQGISGGPSITLLPGRDIVYDVAYGVVDPDDLVFQFAPDWDHEEAIYVSG